VIATVALPVLHPGLVLAEPAAQSARELQVLVGAGQDTVGIDAYLPHTVRVRAGDTVTWRINSDEPHTVSFSQGFAAPSNVIQNPFLAPGDAIPQLAYNATWA
jgi:plastocyanin